MRRKPWMSSLRSPIESALKTVIRSGRNRQICTAAIWSYQDFMDTIDHRSQEMGVRSVQKERRSRRSSKIRVHKGQPAQVQRSDDVPPIARSGYYAWLKKPESDRALEHKRLLRLICASFAASQGVCGAPRVFLDLREAGETCSTHRVARLMRENDIR